MIGIWYLQDKEWIYKSFISDTLGENHEKDVIVEFTNFVIDKKFKKLFHWGKSAEPAMYRNSVLYHKIVASLGNSIWCDICSIFEKNYVAIKGCHSYGLKNIAKAMYSHKMIDALWDEDNSVDSGSNTIVEAWKIHNGLQENGYNTLSDDPRMDNITKYNKADCFILEKIMKYIRETH